MQEGSTQRGSMSLPAPPPPHRNIRISGLARHFESGRARQIQRQDDANVSKQGGAFARLGTRLDWNRFGAHVSGPKSEATFHCRVHQDAHMYPTNSSRLSHSSVPIPPPSSLFGPYIPRPELKLSSAMSQLRGLSSAFRGGPWGELDSCDPATRVENRGGNAGAGESNTASMPLIPPFLVHFFLASLCG